MDFKRQLPPSPSIHQHARQLAALYLRAQGYTLQECGYVMRVSGERFRQIEATAERKARSYLTDLENNNA